MDKRRAGLWETKAAWYLSKIDRHGPSGCWLWTGPKSGNGYGAVSLGRGTNGPHGAHRIAYLLWVGLIPEGLQVLHHCDTPLCVRPSHLFLGTHADNMADKTRKGRLNVQSGGDAMRAKAAKETHCRSGRHRWSTETEWRNPRNGRRVCKACANERRRCYGR